jgi:hypothetical protein
MCTSQADEVTFDLAEILGYRFGHFTDQERAFPKGRVLWSARGQKIAVPDDDGELVD